MSSAAGMMDCGRGEGDGTGLGSDSEKRTRNAQEEGGGAWEGEWTVEGVGIEYGIGVVRTEWVW